jgi:hypothetical protein
LATVEIQKRYNCIHQKISEKDLYDNFYNIHTSTGIYIKKQHRTCRRRVIDLNHELFLKEIFVENGNIFSGHIDLSFKNFRFLKLASRGSYTRKFL